MDPQTYYYPQPSGFGPTYPVQYSAPVSYSGGAVAFTPPPVPQALTDPTQGSGVEYVEGAEEEAAETNDGSGGE